MRFSILTLVCCLAVDAQDHTKAAPPTKGLEDKPLSESQLSEIARALDQIGRTAEAALFRARIPAGPAPSLSPGEAPRVLEEMKKAGFKAEALALARHILAASPRQADESGSVERDRVAALNVLSDAGEREAYALALEQRAKAEDASIEDWLRFAEAVTDPEKDKAAWRQVLARDPHHVRAQRHLAAQARFSSHPTMESVESALVIDPVTTFQGVDRIFDLYAKAKQLSRLEEKILETKFPLSNTGTHMAPPALFSRLASRLAAAGERAAAVNILQKGLAVGDPRLGYGDLPTLLVENLVALDRTDEAAQVLVDSVFGESTPTTTNFVLLDFGRRLGVLGELRRRADIATARGDASAKEVRMFLRCFVHEADALPEFEAYLDGLKTSSYDDPWILRMAGGLVGWPEARPALRKLIELFDRTLERMDAATKADRKLSLAKLAADSGNVEFAVTVMRDALASMPIKDADFRTLALITRAADIAATMKENTMVGECGHAAVQWLASKKPDAWVDQHAMLRLIDLLDGAGCAAERTALSGHFRQHAANDPSLSFAIKLFDAKTEMDRGTLRLAAPIVWLDGTRTTAESATLVWDVGVHVGPLRVDRPATELTRGEALPQLDGRFDVELLFGEEEDAMRSLVRLPKVKARGSWQGVLPAPAGFVRAVFLEGNRFYFSDTVQVCAGRNLLAGADFLGALPSLPRERLKRSEGGPVPDGAFLFCQTESSLPPIVVVRRVELKPECDYVLSCWMRPPQGRSVQLVTQYCERDGRPIDSNRIVLSAEDYRGFWTCQYLRVRPARPGDGGSRFNIPANAAFVEVTLQGGEAGFDLAALSFAEAPAAKAEEANLNEP